MDDVMTIDQYDEEEEVRSCWILEIESRGFINEVSVVRVREEPE